MKFHFHTSPAEHVKYRPEIDGLRAIAILPVLFFHAGLSAFSGGFVGVDIFFVISGYLITAIVAKDVANGEFSFAKFYERRMRRIFPALFFLLFVCTAAAAFLLPPKDFSAFGSSLGAVALFVSNIFFWHTASPEGYFDRDSSTQILLHTWTLSVEEQFYIFLPIGLVLINRWAGRYLRASLIVAAAASFALSLWAVGHKPVGAFYLLPTRAWELLVGALLAVKAFAPLENRMLREAAGVLGLGLIAYAVFTFTKDTPFPGVHALAPCLGAWLLIYAGETGRSLATSILAMRLPVIIGVISYSLYLWHWPIFVFSRYFQLTALDGTQTAVVIFSSVAMAFASYAWVETPFRRVKSALTRARVFRVGGLVSITCAILGLAIYGSHGVPQRYDAQTLSVLAENAGRKMGHGSMGACTHWHQDIHSTTEVAECPIGESHPGKIMFWGDSHVEMLQLSIRRLYDRGALGGKGVFFALAIGCPPTETLTIVKSVSHCSEFAHLAMLRAQQSDVDTVFIGFSTWWDLGDVPMCAVIGGRCEGKLTHADVERLFIEELTQHVRTLKGRGKQVVVSLPFPFYDRDIPDLEIHNAMFARYGSTYRPREVSSAAFREQIQSAATAASAIVYDPRKSLCGIQGCIYEIAGVSIYTDRDHIAVGQSGVLDADLAVALRQSASLSANDSRR